MSAGFFNCTRGGWAWNLWGFDCAGGKKIRLGTDGAEGLAAFLQGKLPGPAAPGDQ